MMELKPKRWGKMENRIIHQALAKDGKIYYLCNQACGTTDNKLTIEPDKVTCKNCLREEKKLR